MDVKFWGLTNWGQGGPGLPWPPQPPRSATDVYCTMITRAVYL